MGHEDKTWWNVIDIGWTSAKDSYCDMIDHAALAVSSDSDGGDFFEPKENKTHMFEWWNQAETWWNMVKW